MAKFEHYKTFVTVCDERNLSAAAKRLHLSPSAVSKQIANLERNAGALLLDRSTRVVEVTDLGQRFYRHCKAILAAVDDAERDIAEALGKVGGKLTLSLPKILLHSNVMELLSQFSEIYPRIKLDLRVSNEFESLIDNRIDFAFRIGKLVDSRLRAIPLMTLHPIFCASPAYLKAHGTPETIADLSDHEMLVPTAVNISEAIRSSDGHFNNYDLDLEQHHTTDDATALYFAILNGMGIGSFMKESASNDIQQKRLIQVLPDVNLGAKKLHLIFYKQGRLPRKLAVFKEFVTDFYN